MGRNAYLTGLLCLCALPACAQELGSLQIHGFATQGILYSSHDNYLTDRSSDGDPGWTEGVLSFSDVPLPKLRVGIQLHYFQLGDLGGNVPTIDWAFGDYKVNEYFGVRAGKVKTPLGLYNDSQDIDAVYLWCLLPQSTYQIDNRSFFLAHLGGEAYGTIRLGGDGGKVSYRAYGGENSLALQGGIVEQISAASGLVFPTAPAGPVYGTDVRWQTPYKPLLVGASVVHQNLSGAATGGSLNLSALVPVFYAKFEDEKFTFAGEYRRQTAHVMEMVGPYAVKSTDDQRQWYAMAAYHATRKLQAGTYYSLMVDESLPRAQQASSSKDLVFSGRFDFNANFYAKLENHSLHGTALGFYAADNPDGLRSRTDVVIAKLGFYF